MIHALGPRTRRIFGLLRHRILSGELPPGARLPSHQHLATEFGVAPMTMRHVLARLEQAGLVSREIGRGTFVRRPAQPRVLIVTRAPDLADDVVDAVAASGRSSVVVTPCVDQVQSVMAAQPAVGLALVELGPPGGADVVAALALGWPDLPVIGLPSSPADAERTGGGPLLLLTSRPRAGDIERLLDLLLPPRSERDGAVPEMWFSRLADPAALVDRGSRRVLAWNATAEALFGYLAAEAGELALDTLVPARVQAELRAQAAASDTAEGDWLLEASTPIELPLVRTGGQEVWVELTATDLGDGTVLLVARDHTVQRATRDTLSFQAELLEAVGQAVVATDPRGHIQYWNRGAERLYGWRADEVLGRNIGEVIVAPALLERGREIMARLREGASWSGEFPVQRRDGTSLPVLVTDSPIRDPDGRLVGIIGVGVDLTERKQAEQDRLERARLEGLLLAATEQLARLGYSQ